MAGVACGSQAALCEYPVRLDTYSGCSHGCRYCFSQNKVNLDDIRILGVSNSLRGFIDGKRDSTTSWCDWKIPVHWGGLSDPFQPAERYGKTSLDVLRVLRETQYPRIVSTKGALIVEEPYLSMIAECNIVVQVSMVCSSYDKMEQGAPTFEERLRMVEKLSGKAKRVIVRAQPYITNVKSEFIKNVPRFADAGAHGVTVEGMKFKKKKPTLVKVAGDWCYPEEVLKGHYTQIRYACHDNGLSFYCAENRLRKMGDSTACCGCDGLDGFEGNRFNAVNVYNGEEVKPTDAQRMPNTWACFGAIYQYPGKARDFEGMTFEDMVNKEVSKMGAYYGV